MSHDLYAVTAIIGGKPAGAFVTGRNPDDVISKAAPHLGENGRITHIVPLCEVRLGTLQRNGLLELCSKADQVEFLADTLLDITGVMINQMTTLRSCLETMTGTLVEKLGLRQFSFTIILKNTGVVQLHENFAPNLESAQKAAIDFAQSEYGEHAVLQSIREVTR